LRSVAEVLGRKRRLSIEKIRRVHEVLGISAEVLIGPTWRDEEASGFAHRRPGTPLSLELTRPASSPHIGVPREDGIGDDEIGQKSRRFPISAADRGGLRDSLRD